MTVQDEVKRLLSEVVLPPEYVLPKGATTEELEHLSTLLPVPVELQEWLILSNGSLVGPGGLFGIGATKEWLKIENYFAMHPEWLKKGWIPIAGDGCGNYYVLDVTGTSTVHPIYFVDHEISYEEPAYVVASGLWTFLRFLLESELLQTHGEPTYWPFDKAKVLSLVHCGVNKPVVSRVRRTLGRRPYSEALQCVGTDKLPKHLRRSVLDVLLTNYEWSAPLPWEA